MELDAAEKDRIFRIQPNMRGMMRRSESGALVAAGAVIVGDVRLARDVNIWFGCVLRGDDEPITVGEASNVQDGTIVHVDIGYPTVIGRGVTIGHKATVHGCKVGDYALIGMGSIVMSGAEVGEKSIVAAGALVPEGMRVPPRTLVLGIPAKISRRLTEEELAGLEWRPAHYVERARTYL